ncbi:MAG: hypothetical protein ACJAYJ_004392 [Saprospiraceae bacterium]
MTKVFAFKSEVKIVNKNKNHSYERVSVAVLENEPTSKYAQNIHQKST